MTGYSDLNDNRAAASPGCGPSLSPGREAIFDRMGRLVGAGGMERLGALRVLVIGVGGVGSWAAEALVRDGVGHLTIADADRVCVSNINRQLMATVPALGELKVEALARRLLAINPELDLTVIARRFTAEDAADFRLGSYDFIIDAIDSLSDKAALMLAATARDCPARLVSSMGAALKLDPTRVRVDEFGKVKGCRLAAALRNKFKRLGRRPMRRIRCVYSDEQPPKPVGAPWEGTADADGAAPLTYGKVATSNGAAMHVTATFGLCLAAEVVRQALQ